MTQAKPSRILMIDLGDTMGGVEAYLEALSRVLSEGADLYALCVMEELEQKLKACGVRVIRIPLFSKLRLLRFTVAAIGMIYLAMRYRIRVIQINGFFESTLLIPARLFGLRTVYTRHGPFEIDLFPWYRKPLKYIPRLLSRYLGHLASQVVCVSETVGSLYKPLLPPGKVAVIPNWITLLPTRKMPRLNERGITHILCVGRLEKYKGVQLLIEAVRGLGGVQLTIVGEGAFRRELEKLAAGQPVRFAGFQKDTFPFYRKADIFVMPSLGPEGLPMVSLEAMSHMLPCIFSNLPVHAEITSGGDAALLFRCGDASDLRAKLLHLIECPDERARLAENAYLAIQEKYDESVARDAYLKAFAIVPLTHLEPVAYKGVPCR